MKFDENKDSISCCRLLLDGAQLIAVHKARYFKTKEGLCLGPGELFFVLQNLPKIEFGYKIIYYVLLCSCRRGERGASLPVCVWIGVFAKISLKPNELTLQVRWYRRYKHCKHSAPKGKMLAKFCVMLSVISFSCALFTKGHLCLHWSMLWTARQWSLENQRRHSSLKQ